MDDTTILQLNAINRAFYAQVADEFDATRAGAWAGWERLIPYLIGVQSVLDVGCGNGRFGVFLAQHAAAPLSYHGIDNSAALLARARTALSDQPNLAAVLEARDLVEQPLDVSYDGYDLVVGFGVLHHIPGADRRRAFIRALADQVAPRGLLIYTEWRFYEQARFRAKVIPFPPEIAPHVEANDFLLDWGGDSAAVRYCHYVDDAEHTALIEGSGLALVETFRADGHSGDTNVYCVLRKTQYAK